MSLICSCGRPLLVAMCQHELLAFFGVHPVLRLVAICEKTTVGVAAVPVPRDGRHLEQNATYETGPRVNTADESQLSCGAVGGVKTVCHVDVNTRVSVGS